MVASNRATNGQLRALVERVERLEEEKKEIGAVIRNVYAEAKAGGFDATVLRQVVRLRAQDADKRREQDEIRALYLDALGMES